MRADLKEHALQFADIRADLSEVEIIFFVSRPDEAMVVARSDDLLGDVAAEPMEADGPEGLASLASALGVGPDRRAAWPLRDATCRSFPVWQLDDLLCRRLAALDEVTLDECAMKWSPNTVSDLHERASCLSDLKRAICESADDERLFALFEERAF